jgi:hypothetical protein
LVEETAACALFLCPGGPMALLLPLLLLGCCSSLLHIIIIIIITDIDYINELEYFQ